MKIDNLKKRAVPTAVFILHVNPLDMHLICKFGSIRGLIKPKKFLLEKNQRRTWNPVKSLNDGASYYF